MTRILLAMVVLAAIPAATRAAGGGAGVFRATLHGEVALASWTTCPQWQAGLVCDDTVIIASDAATSERWPDGRLRDREPRVVLQRFHNEVTSPAPLCRARAVRRPNRLSRGSSVTRFTTLRGGMSVFAQPPRH